MATTPVVARFDWKSLIPVLELAGNTAVTVLVPGGAVYASLLAALEQSVNPLLQSIGTKPDVTNETMAVYGTVIAALNVVKMTKGIDAATLAKVNEYIAAAMDGAAAYLRAGAGFAPGNYQPVVPIA